MDRTIVGIPLKPQISINTIYSLLTFDATPTFRFDGERHNFWELDYILEGSLWCTSEDMIYECQANDILLHRPNAFHSSWTAGDKEARVLCFSFSGVGLEQFMPSGIMRSDNELQNLFNLLLNEAPNIFRGYDINSPLLLSPTASEDDVGFQLIKNYLEIICLAIKRKGKDILCPPSEDKKAVKFKRITEYLKENVTRNLTSADICTELAESYSSLKTLFRQFTNTGLINYYNYLRCEYCIYLINSGLSMNEIAYTMNFSSQNYFSYFFKKNTGISPTKYNRQENLS